MVLVRRKGAAVPTAGSYRYVPAGLAGRRPGRGIHQRTGYETLRPVAATNQHRQSIGYFAQRADVLKFAPQRHAPTQDNWIVTNGAKPSEILHETPSGGSGREVLDEPR